MINRPGAAVFAVSMPLIMACAGMAQEIPSPEIVVNVNEGIYLYVAGAEDQKRYEEAITVLSGVLDRDSDNKTALLFRALCHGELGLKALERRRVIEADITGYNVVLQTDPTASEDPIALIQRLDEEIAGYEAVKEPDAALLGRWNIALARREQANSIKTVLETDMPVEHFRELLGSSSEEALTLKRLEKENHEHMARDITRLLGLVDGPKELIRLLNVVANAKIARIDEITARDLIDERISSTNSGSSARALRKNATDRFRVAEQTLRQLLGGSIKDDMRTRARFLLGVILYRQAVPMRADKEGGASLTPVQKKKLQESLDFMRAVADDPETTGLYAPYSPYYVGLILPFMAAGERDPDGRAQILDEAERYLDLAGQRDVKDYEGGTPVSRTNNLAYLIAKQKDEIQKIREVVGTQVSAPDMNDIRLSIGIGFNRDTNVELLGDNTALPRDISRDEDFGFPLITAIDYTKQLAPRWYFGFQGRVSQLWHADVDEFDQQTYGGTVALQYELMEQGETQGPVYLSLQYDYDYTLLGRAAFLDSHAIRPSIRAHWNERKSDSELYARYNIRDYREPLSDRRFNRDGDYVSIGFLHNQKFVNMTPYYENKNIEPWGHPGDSEIWQDNLDGEDRYLKGRFLLEYGWDATDGDEFDRKAYIAGFGVGVPLPLGIDLDFTAQFEWGDYSRGSLVDFHRRPRQEFIQQYGLGFSRTFVLKPGEYENRFSPQFDRTVMTVRAFVDYTEDDANVVDRSGQAVYSYDRWVYGITFGFAFN